MMFRNNTYYFFLCLLLSYSLIVYPESKKTITIIGTGYVGLVSGACLAEIGNSVICADIDVSKIMNLQQGIIPIHEQGLNEIIAKNVEAGRLTFTHNINDAIHYGDIIFIAVGTPMGEDGSANLSYIDDVVKTIANTISSYKIIVTKSTVPIGTGKNIRAKLENEFNVDPMLFNIVSNPEFLREGVAVNDFLEPDRLIMGAENEESLITMCEIYEPIISSGTPCILTNIQTSEMIKYASNAFLSVKISYINEIANICDAVDADVKTVARAMGLDHRISPQFLQPGPGFGGSCFPKDAQALIYIAQKNNIPLHTVQAALDANDTQQKKPVEKLVNLLHNTYDTDLTNKNIAVLGLAFKANTDDVRYSPAITTIKLLQEKGATIQAYDPIASDNMKKIFPDIHYYKSPYKAVTNSDAIIIMTDWDEIKQLDFAKIKMLVKTPIVIDARNIINPEILRQLGFTCDAIGQSYLYKQKNKHPYNLIPSCSRKYKQTKRYSNIR